jgi:hypothetical protein
MGRTGLVDQTEKGVENGSGRLRHGESPGGSVPKQGDDASKYGKTLTSVPFSVIIASMQFGQYVDAIGGLVVMHRGTGIPVSTLSRLKNEPHKGCNIVTAHKIVEFSRQNPAPSGETVRYEDLLPVDSEAA